MNLLKFKKVYMFIAENAYEINMCTSQNSQFCILEFHQHFKSSVTENGHKSRPMTNRKARH